MCTWDSDSSPWTLLHFVGVGLTAFSSYSPLFIGGQELLQESIVLLFVGLPIIFIQLKLGGMLKSSMYGLFSASFPFFRGVAVMMVMFNLIFGMYYPIISVHNICAGFSIISGERELMQSCANSWNTPSCRTPLVPDTETTDLSNYTYNYYGGIHAGENPVEQYIRNKFFQTSDITLDDLHGFAGPAFPLVLALTWLFIFFIVGFGPKLFGWIVSIMGIVSTVMMVGVLANGWAQFPFSSDGLLFYYLPNFNKMLSVLDWKLAVSQIGWLSILSFGILPTMGKFTGSGTISQNITWLFLILQLVILRHLPALTIVPYSYASSENMELAFGDRMSRYIQIRHVAVDFIYSGASPAAAFFYFLANYIYHVCANALSVLMILDNLMEMFDWLLSSRECNKRVVWLASSAVLCTVLLLCGIPFSTRGGEALLFFFDISLGLFEILIRYFVTVGLIVIYVWQKTLKVERFVIGIWAVLAAAVWVLFCAIQIFETIDLSHLSPGIRYTNLDEKDVWSRNSLILGALPICFVFIWMFIYAIQFCSRRSRSSEMTLDHPPPYDDAILLNQPGKLQDEDVEHVSSF